MKRKRIRVKVTKRDIERGVPDSGLNCPIALSLRRHRFQFIWVGPADVEFRRTWSEPVQYVDLPDTAQNFVHKFDDHRPVDPFEFDLVLPA